MARLGGALVDELNSNQQVRGGCRIKIGIAQYGRVQTEEPCRETGCNENKAKDAKTLRVLSS